MQSWLMTHENLIHVSSEVGYDFDEYSNHLTSTLEEMSEELRALHQTHNALSVAREELF